MCIIIQIGHHRCCIMKNMSTNGDDQNLWASTPTAISSTPVSMSSSSFGGFLKVGSPVIIPVMTMKETVTWGWPMTQETPISIHFLRGILGVSLFATTKLGDTLNVHASSWPRVAMVCSKFRAPHWKHGKTMDHMGVS